jgi:hypothetical protein
MCPSPGLQEDLPGDDRLILHRAPRLRVDLLRELPDDSAPPTQTESRSRTCVCSVNSALARVRNSSIASASRAER